MAEGAPEVSAGWRAWFDGSALPNPGRMGLGFVLQGPDGSVDEGSFVTREAGCNNEAAPACNKSRNCHFVTIRSPVAKGMWVFRDISAMRGRF